LSGEFKSRAGDPKNGPAAGSGYVLWSRGKVKACRLRQNQDAWTGCARKSAPVEGLEAHAGSLPQLAECCGKLQARCGKPRAIGGGLPLRRASFATEKRIGGSAYAA
jgi:hypothetical protein